MKKTLVLASLSLLASAALAQNSREFEGLNLAFGFSRNATTASASSSTDTASSKTMVGMAKVNYTFPLEFPAKLGVSASFDLKNSRISDGEMLATSTPTEISLEPGLLLYTESLVYAKLGTYSSSYETTNGSRKLTGKHYGLGLKHFVYDAVFIQGEITARKSDPNNVGTGWDGFKQRSTSLLVGYTF